MTLLIIAGYLLIVLAIGLTGHRLFRGTSEDYFVASRTIGPFVLLMSLFGTHMTAFSLLGASGEAYRRGIGVFALMASSSALVAPLVFLFIGTRVWSVGKRLGHLTQIEFFRHRWNSKLLGNLLAVVLVGLLVPYLLIGVKGGGITLHQITGESVPEWAGSLVMCLVVMIYVIFGGVRSTAWANTFQTMVFMILGGLACAMIVRQLGGLSVAMSRVLAERPDLLIRGESIRPLELLTYALIPLSVGMFPHVFMHWLTARSAGTFRFPIVAYPVCVAIVWVPSVLLGVLGALEFPGLVGGATNSVLVRLIHSHAPGFMAGLLAAGVLAAVMSSLDSQTLSISTLLTRELQRWLPKGSSLRQAVQSNNVLVGRAFVAVVLTGTFLLSIGANRSLFRLGIWSFSGFAALFPLIVAALYWRRSTSQGAVACVITTAILWSYLFMKAWKTPGYTIGDTGIMPVAILVVASSVALIVGSLLSRPPDEERTLQYFPRSGNLFSSDESSA